MSRTVGLAIFLAVILSVLLGIHFFLWARLIRDPHWPRPWNVLASIALALAAVSIPTSLFLRRSAASAVSEWLVWPAYVWLGTMFLIFMTLLGIDVVRAGLWLIRRGIGGGPAGVNLERRQMFARWLAAGAGAVAAGLGLTAIRSARGPVLVHRVEIPLARLAPEHDGITVVQLTDIHVGPTIGRRQIEELVASTNALDPDVVAITGDLVDGGVAELRDAIAPLRGLRARHGVFFVTGNHEYFSGAQQWVDELTRLGIRVLRNERVVIGTHSTAFELAGVDDRSAARFAAELGHGEDLGKALRGWDRKSPVVLLAHQPRTVLDAAKFGVDLQVSGHTHGGQIWPFGALVRLQQQFLAGLDRHRDTFIFVSRGAGYWGPPMRLGAPPEISQLVLRSVA
jgi:predicted MPP superfamily phosphohydrolase